MRPSRLRVPAAILLGLALATSAPPARASVADSTGVPYLASITTLPAVPCSDVPTRLVLSGTFTNGCGRKLGHDPARFLVAVSPNASCSVACATVMTPWADTLELGRLAAGSHLAVVTLAVVDNCVSPPDSTFYRVPFGFTVTAGCAPDPLRYLDVVRIGAADSVLGGVCEGDSIRVFLAGHFPDNCHLFRGVRLLPSPIVGPMPEPDVVQLLFDDMCCVKMPCLPTPTPWSAEVTLPPLPERDYQLMVEAVEVCCRDTVQPGDPSATRSVPFVVGPAGSCGEPLACLLPVFDHSGRVGGCDTGFDGEGHARLTLDIASTVALAGLQGRVSVHAEDGRPGGLAVIGIEAIGPAGGMHLTWEPVAEGAKFVLFAAGGAPIPAVVPGAPPPPVLRFTLERLVTLDPGGFAPDTTRKWYVYADDLLGADATARGVPPCPVRDAGRLVAEAGTVCVSGECDLNRDGRADVRDLVRMVRCLQGTGPCPPDSLGTLDCEGDFDFDLADVLCCARTVLGLPHGHGPGDSTRTEPRIAVTFGAPARFWTGIEVPVHIEGVDRIGAARLEFRIPSSGIAAASVVPATASGDWLALDSWTAGTLTLGLIGLGPPGPTFAPLPTGLDLTIHLGLSSGAEVVGQVALAGSDFSGVDGVLLATDFGTPVVRIGAGVSLTVDPARPNPFATSTLIRLTLDAPAVVELGVYDLAGRRLVTLHSGPLASGVHGFDWDGRRDDGGRVPSGVYFARAGVTGRPATVQKLVMVRGD